MGWSAQMPLRRIFLISSTNSQASTLQSFDAILRSDPLTSRADWRVRAVLIIMLAIGPALSVAYKALGGGETRFTHHSAYAHFGLTGPPGTQNIGYGISQFVNATLPWFKDSGFDRVYGFNLHVATENMSAMLDGPMPDYVASLQEFMAPSPSKIVTATVPAIVCEIAPNLDHDVAYYQNLTRVFPYDTTGPSYADTWVTTNKMHVSMLLPVEHDNTNIITGDYSTLLNETFGDHLECYTLSRQNYKGSWRVTQTSVELIAATPSYEKIDDGCLLTNNWVALADLFTRMFAEFDYRFRPSGEAEIRQKIKTDSTLLAGMLWARLAAVAPVTEYGSAQNPLCYPDKPLPKIQYNTNVVEETAAQTIKPSIGTIVVLVLYPVILFGSLLFRTTWWPLSPIGEGFGLISLLASVESGSLALLRGASFSGKLERPVFIGFQVGTNPNTARGASGSAITSILDTRQSRSDKLVRGVKYG